MYQHRLWTYTQQRQGQDTVELTGINTYIEEFGDNIGQDILQLSGINTTCKHIRNKDKVKMLCN